MKHTLQISRFCCLFFLLLLSNTSFGQASACPAVTVPNAGPICSGNCVNLTATVQGSVATTSYAVSTIPYSPYSYTTGTAVLVNIDDVWTPVINIPFCFQFFGNTYNQMVIGSNGLISFNLAYANAYCQWPINAAIPSASDPINSIMCPWHDIDPSIGSSSDTRYQVYGTAPCREFVISWYNIPMFSSSCNSQLASQQIVLHETTNIIDMYITNKPLCSSWNGGAAIEGIQDATGAVGVAVGGRNYPTQWTAANDGKRFMPTGAPQYTLAWTGPSGSLGSANPITVCPTATTTYTCTVTNTTCSGNVVVTATPTVTVTAGLTVTGSQVNSSSCTVCNGTATTNVTVGTGPFTYVWSPSPGGGQGTATATGLCPGNYTCTVTNPTGCTGTQTFAITGPTAPTSTQAHTNLSCNGVCNGTATITPNPVGTYTYAWSPSVGSTATVSGLCAGTYTVTATNPGGCITTQTITITQPPALTATQSQVNITCNGVCNGSATVVPSGGTPAYSYSWAPAGGTGPTAPGLCAGTYTCTITDANGCSITKSFTITQPPALTATQSQVNITCNGVCNGSATVVPSGGTPAYSYSWAPAGGTGPTAPGLCAGTYTCTITDANGCSITKSFTITQPPALTATQSQVNITCNGVCNGSATVVPSGGTPTYSYSWAPAGGTGPTAPGLCAGTYTCTITDANGCTITKTFTITQPSLLTSSSTSTPATCGNATGTVTANPAGGSPAYTYSWNSVPVQTTQTATGLLAGSYTCTITDSHGCISTTVAVVGSTGGISGSITSTINVSCFGGNDGSATAAPSGGTGPYSYSWNTAPVQTTATASGLTIGSYTCTITDANGCLATVTVTITQPPVLTATVSQVNVLCNSATTGTATVNPAGGTPVYSYSWNTVPIQTTQTATGLAAGSYTCTITDSHGCILTKTFTITQPTALTASTTSTPSTCGNPNGTATVTAGGGTGLYSYSWNSVPVQTTQTATGLSAGPYTVTVTDGNGCTQTATVTVTNTGGPSASITASSNITCFNANNGSATVTASGGTPGYTYSWNSAPVQTTATATNLPPGSYTVTVTDANTCSTTASVTITQPPVITTTFSQTNVFCNGGCNGTATVVPSGGTGTYTYAWAPSGGTAATASSLCAGSYTCTISSPAGCTITQSFIITQPPALTTSVSQVDELCNGASTGSATVNPAGGTPAYTYSWSTVPVQTTQTASGLAAGSYTCTITDANLCTTTASFTITQPPLLSATTSSVQSTCGNPNGTATVNITGGTPVYSVSWNTVPVQTTLTATGLLAGSYTVTVTDANLCSTTATVTVTNAGSPTASISSVTNVSCFGGNNGSIDVIGSGGTLPYTYSWNSVPVQTTATASGLVAGSYTVTITDANGCTASADTIVTQPPALGISGTSTNVDCFGNASGSADVITTGGSPAYTYSWAPSGGSGANAPSLSAGTYTCTVTDNNGCIITQSLTVTEPPQLTLAIAGFNVTCFNSCNGQVVVIPTGGVPNYTFAWNTGCNSPSCNNICAGSYTVDVTDANGCLTTASTTVTQPSAISIVTSEVDAHCNQADGSASALASGGTGTLNYQWIGGPATANYNGITPNTYSVIVTDANACSDTATTTVNNLNGVNANLVSVTNLTCFNSNNGSIVTGASGGIVPYTYAWTAPASSINGTANALPAGNYTLTVTDASGCSTTVSATVTQPTDVTITASATPAAVCSGTGVQISSTGAGGTPGYTYAWAPGPLAGNTQNIIPSASTTYTAYVVDANGCSDSTTVLVTVNPVPVAAFAGDVLSGCAPLCVNFADLSSVAAPGVITSWTWNFGDATPVSNQQSPNHCFNNPGAYSVTLDITTADGCSATLTMPNYISVFANPVAAFGVSPQPTTILNPEIMFTDSSTNATTWSWSFGDLLNSASTLQNPTFTYPDPTCYVATLTVTSIDGCTDDTTREICIGPDATIYVPNAFTPNGDGTNDYFMPLGIGIDPDHFEMWIFDRWGNMIYYTDDMSKGWDGRVQGHSEIAQIDTYVWKIKAIDIVGNKHNLLGKVSVVK